jgi:RNA polymerase sigma-70 factor (ECF subfamily)
MVADDSTPTHALLRQAQAGSREAFESLVLRYRERLERQIEARMGRGVRLQLEAADVLQDTLARAFESIAHFRWQGEDSVYRWFASIAEHLIWNAAKKRTPEPLRLEPEAGRDTSVGKQLRREERFDRLQRALAALTPEQREAILLTRIEGLSLKEAAERLGRSADAVQKLVARGLLALRRSIGDTESLRLPERSLTAQEDPKHE